MTIISSSKLANGNLFAVGTDGKTNSVFWFDGTDPISWNGHEITCACASGNAVVCPAVNGHVYLVANGKVVTIKHDDKDAWYFGVAASGDDQAIAGGRRGRLLHVDIGADNASATSFVSLGVRKGGRDVLNMASTKFGTLAIGKGELLHCLSSPSEVAFSLKGTGKEVLYFSCCENNGEIWLSGLEGRRTVLGKYSPATDTIEYFETPFGFSGRAPSIASSSDKLILASDCAYIGAPDDWVRLDAFESPSCISILASENKCDLISFDGKTVRLQLPT